MQPLSSSLMNKELLPQKSKAQGYSRQSVKERAEQGKGVPGEQLFQELKESPVVLKAVKIIAMVKSLR